MNELFIQTSNLKLGALSSGDKSEPPVIALHGWLDNAASFIPIAEFMTGFHLVALDLPGHGKSEHRCGVNAYHFVDYAADVVLAADALGFEHFSLLGHSLGAGVAGLVASVAPERIKRLALVEGLAPVTGRPDDVCNQLRKHIDKARDARRTPSVYLNKDEAVVARQNAGDFSLASAELIAERNLVAGEDGFRWHTDRCLRQPSPVYLSEDHVKAYLKKIECETLLVRSSNGIIMNWDSLRGREPYVENLTLVDIEGGHHCHMDDPQSVAEHVVPFLSR